MSSYKDLPLQSIVFLSISLPTDAHQHHLLADASKIVDDILCASDDSDVLHDVELQSFLIPELTTIIGRIDAFDYDPDDLEFVYHALHTKAMAFAARFRMTGELDNIDESISSLKTMAHFPDCEPSDVAFGMLKSAELRYRCTKSADDLDRLIESEEAVLQFEDFRSQHIFVQLALDLWTRFQKKNDVADCERLLSLSEEIPPFLSVTSDYLCCWSRIKAVSITSLSQMGRKFSDIREMFEHVENNVLVSGDAEFTDAAHFFLAEQLQFAALDGDLPQLRQIRRIVDSRQNHTRWGVSLKSLVLPFESSEAELDESIALLRAGCSAVDVVDECIPMYTMVLAAALFQRFWRLGKPQDLQEALAFREPLPQFGANLVDLTLATYASCYLHPEYKEARKMALNRHLGDESEAWLASCPKPSTIDELHEKELEVLSRSYQIPDFSLSQDEIIQYKKQSAIASLLLERDDSNTYPGCKLGFNKFMSILAAGPEFPSVDQLAPALDFLYFYANDQRVSAPDRLSAMKIWFLCLNIDGLLDKQKHRVSEMCDIWLSVVKEQNCFSSNARGTLSLQRNLNAEYQVLTNIVLIFIKASNLSGTGAYLNRALQILDFGRLLLWEQFGSLHETVRRLAVVNNDLSIRLEKVTMALRCHLGLASSPYPRRLGYHSFFAHEEKRRIIEEIRSIAESEDALQVRMQLEGPIVTLLAPQFDSCFALIITLSCCHSIKFLPIPSGRLERLHAALRSFTKSRSTVQCEGINLSIDDDGSPVASTSSHRAGRQRCDPLAQSVEEVLEQLWDSVAEPVLERIWEITDSESIPKGKERAGRKPVPALYDRQRIWWCCVGEFSFMPIHAAGIYRGDKRTSVSDYFISSYTPTIGILLAARTRPLPNGCKILTVAQPDPGVGMFKLPSVRTELQKIVEIVPHNNLIPLSGSAKPDPEGRDATVENVVSKLPDANILHIACHGVQDLKDPLNSGFILADGKRLTVEEIMKLDLPNAHTAILNACHTASNDPVIPDESINLASALLHAGFISILGTKWPMSDDDGPLIAEEVYKHMFKWWDISDWAWVILPHVRRRWVLQQDPDWSQKLSQLIDEERETESRKEDKLPAFLNKVSWSVLEDLHKFSGRSLSLFPLPEIMTVSPANCERRVPLHLDGPRLFTLACRGQYEIGISVGYLASQ